MKDAAPIPLIALFQYLKKRGVEPEQVVDSGIVAMMRRRAGDRISAGLYIETLQRCAVLFDDPLFGLRYGQQADAKVYGPLSLLWRYAPSVRYSNRVTMRILSLEHEGLTLAVREQEDTTTVLYRIETKPGHEQRQFVESGVSFMLSVCRLILGRKWRPLSVLFAHEPVDDPARYADILNAPVRFGAPENGIVFSSADFDRQSPEHNAEILTFVERSLLRVSHRDALPFRARLNQVVDDLIAIHKPNLDAAATAMAMSKRTLQRHLAADAICFRDVVSERRRAIIETWRQRSAKPSLALLAERTAFSEASTVSRFMRRSGPRPR